MVGKPIADAAGPAISRFLSLWIGSAAPRLRVKLD